MTLIDPQRTVPAVRDRVEGGLAGPDIRQPGEMFPETCITGTGELQKGYIIFCPGCARELWIATSGPGSHWEESGDLDAGTLSITPSIWHHDDCEWHGFLRDGIFRPV